MSLSVWESVLSFAEAAGEYFCDISALSLLLLPAAVFLVWFVLCASCRGVRARSKTAYLFVSDISIFLFCALALFARQELEAVIGVALVFRAAYFPFYGILCLFRPKPEITENLKKKEQRKNKKRKEASPLPESDKPLLASDLPQAEPMPRMVRCFERTDPGIVVEQDVRLGHIFLVLERLKNLPLGAGDRLEAQKYEDLLSVYRNKGNLSSAEAQTLNDILASLLKMMAKYGV